MNGNTFTETDPVDDGHDRMRIYPRKDKDSRPEGAEVLSAVTVYLVLPCVIVNAFQIEVTGDVRRGFLAAVSAVAIYHILLLPVCLLLRRILGLHPVEEASIYFSNSGNMIMPLVAAVLGDSMVIYASAFFCVQNLFTWTYGHSLLSGKKSFEWQKIIRNPNLISYSSASWPWRLRQRPP